MTQHRKNKSKCDTNSIFLHEQPSCFNSSHLHFSGRKPFCTERTFKVLNSKQTANTFKNEDVTPINLSLISKGINKACYRKGQMHCRFISLNLNKKFQV